MKTCPRCDTSKPFDAFREKHHSKGRYYRSTWCRECDVEYARAWRGRHPGYHAGKSRGYRAEAVRMIPLILLALPSCATPGEVVSVVDDDRLNQIAVTTEAAYMRLKPRIDAVSEAVDDLRADQDDTFGRALERVDHAAAEARQAMDAESARHAALTATQRDTARRDALSRDVALGLRMDRHAAAQDGTVSVMRADLAAVKVTSTAAGVTARANAGRLASVEKRVAAEDEQDRRDRDAVLDAVASAEKRIAGEMRDRFDSAIPKMQSKLIDTSAKWGAILIAAIGVGGWIWSKIKARKA